MSREDKELNQYRNLMVPPGTFEDGFTWTALVGAVFIGLVMVPGSIYMHLLAGLGVGRAAQWVTVILFLEVAKRAHKNLSKAELFILFYMAGAVIVAPLEGLIWAQFFVQSKAAVGQGIAEMIPSWFAPNDPKILANRSFFQLAWMPAVGLVVFKQIISRINNNVIGYGLFKITSDIEKLPFPMAPIGAQGMMALAEDMDESESKKTTWRWRVFSIGGAIGMTFGFLYMGLPTLSQALFGTTIQMFPIPFADWTGRTQDFLPAVATGLSFDLGALILGMVIPFWAVIGSFVGLLITVVLNPILYSTGILSTWSPGDSTVETLFDNTVDFYFSFGLGISLAIAVIGLVTTLKSLRKRVKKGEEPLVVKEVKNKGRGDIPLTWVGIIYLITTATYIVVCGVLIKWHLGVMLVLLFIAYIYTPLLSYVTARLEGMVGLAINIPFVREAGLILSGYHGVACWFLPFPIANYGIHTVFYRQSELIGSKFTSKWKAEALLVPFIIICSIFFAQLIWSMGPIPSSNYPYAAQMWEFNAKNQALLYSSTMGGYSKFQEAFSFSFIGIGMFSGLFLYGILALCNAPTLLLYGCVQGLNQTMPHIVIPQLLGALLSRFYFERKMGFKQWRQYAPVLSAGFFCGAGLITMFCIGVMFLSKSIIKLPY